MKNFSDLREEFSKEDTGFKKIEKPREVPKEAPEDTITSSDLDKPLSFKDNEIKKENFYDDGKLTVSKVIEKVNEKLAESTHEEFRAGLKKAIDDVISKTSNISQKEADDLRKEAFEKMGYGCLEKYIADPEITEIIVQTFDDIYVEKDGKVEKVEETFESEDELIRIIKKIVHMQNRTINLVHPSVDTVMFDGSRVSACLPPVAVNGATMTIRKFSKRKLTMNDLLQFKSITKDAAHF